MISYPATRAFSTVALAGLFVALAFIGWREDSVAMLAYCAAVGVDLVLGITWPTAALSRPYLLTAMGVWSGLAIATALESQWLGMLLSLLMAVVEGWQYQRLHRRPKGDADAQAH